MILIQLYICIGFIFVTNAQSLFRPTLPLGKYRLVIKASRQCENSKPLPMQVHLYLNKIASNITEFRGNFTIGVPLDDSLIGKYRLIFKALRQCENSKHLPIQSRLYLNKKSSNITEFRGNFTIGVPLDDSLIIDGNAAFWDSIGGWKPNSIVYVANNACSKAKFLAGNAWDTLVKAFNIPSRNCPIPMGTYSTSTGYDLALLEDNNLPKVYFYGKYKFVTKIKTKDNKLLGCMVLEVELLRPWEV